MIRTWDTALFVIQKEQKFQNQESRQFLEEKIEKKLDLVDNRRDPFETKAICTSQPHFAALRQS